MKKSFKHALWFISLSLIISACTNFPLVRQNLSIVKRNVMLFSTVVDVNETMIRENHTTSLIVLSLDGSELRRMYTGTGLFEIIRQNTAEFQGEDQGLCVSVFRYDIPAPPRSMPCKEFVAGPLAIIGNVEHLRRVDRRLSRLERRVSKNEKEIIEVRELTEKNSDAALSSFQLSTTNSNVLVAQNEFYESVKKTVSDLNGRVRGLDSKFSGFATSIRSQLGSLNANVSQLQRSINDL